MSETKQTGIATDNYKLDKFKEELNKIGITEIKIKPLKIGTSVIIFEIDSSKINQVSKVCNDIQKHFDSHKPKVFTKKRRI